MVTKSKTTEATKIAIRSNHNRNGSNSLYAFERALYRTDDGRLYFRETGGAAMSADHRPDYVDRAEAIDWIADEATDPITGYGYTREQAARMVEGVDAGKGYRKNA